jgi:hypothetical protein
MSAWLCSSPPAMMGTKVRLFRPLTNVSLEDLVPKDHFYRHVERTLDLSFVRELVRDRADRAGQTYDGPIPPDHPISCDWTLLGSADYPVIQVAVRWLQQQECLAT